MTAKEKVKAVILVAGPQKGIYVRQDIIIVECEKGNIKKIIS